MRRQLGRDDDDRSSQRQRETVKIPTSVKIKMKKVIIMTTMMMMVWDTGQRVDYRSSRTEKKVLANKQKKKRLINTHTREWPSDEE